MSTSASRGFVWTDEEVELLLRVTLDYKTKKYQENVDWESCQSKYKDITEEFVRQYPEGRKEDFPHSGGEVTSKAQITSKLKAVRTKYRKAVDTGKRSGQGRVVFIYFELCQQIWAGSPATETIAGGLETLDDEDEVPAITPTSSSEVQDSDDPDNGTSSEVVNSRRNLLQAKLDGHRRERLKRKLHSDPAVEEDLRIKRRMLELAELAEESEKSHKEQLAELTKEMKTIGGAITEGLALLRELVAQPQPQHQHGQHVYAEVHRLPSGFSQLHYTPGPMQHLPSAVLPHGHSTPTFHGVHAPSYRRMLLHNDSIEEQDFVP